jgi:hypothetical protein
VAQYVVALTHLASNLAANKSSLLYQRHWVVGGTNPNNESISAAPIGKH